MRHKKAAFLLVMAVAAMWAVRPAFAEGLKVAVIDVNRILNESAAGKEARKKMEARYEELKKKVEKMNEEARKMKEDLDKQKILLGKEKVKEKEEALAAKVADLRQLTQESEKEMQTRQEELTRGILKVVEGKIETLVAEEKIDLLLEKSSGVVHASPAMDVTAKVLERMNQEGAGGK